MIQYPLDETEYRNLTQSQFDKIYPKLSELYPDAHCALNHRNPFELLVATILSAQCTDERVNMVTPALFERFPTPEAMAEATGEEIEELIKSAGFYRNKARNILGASRMLVEQFGGQVPRTMEELIRLPGVARKTANVVLGNSYGINEGIPVDTHVTRLAGRLGLSRYDVPEKIEQDLMREAPQEEWAMVSHRLIWHGRQICQARKPMCDRCTLAEACPTGQDILAGLATPVATK